MDRTVFKAAESGDFKLIQGLSQPQILDLVTPQMCTILHIAVRFNQSKFKEQLVNFCTRLLLKANVVVEAPLHIATRVANQEMVRLLIDRASDVESRKTDARTMLRMRDLAKKEYPLSSPPLCCGSNGMNALHAAVIRTHHEKFDGIFSHVL